MRATLRTEYEVVDPGMLTDAAFRLKVAGPGGNERPVNAGDLILFRLDAEGKRTSEPPIVLTAKEFKAKFQLVPDDKLFPEKAVVRNINLQERTAPGGLLKDDEEEG